MADTPIPQTNGDSLGEALRALRLARGLYQTDVQARRGFGQSKVTRIERNEVSVTLNDLKALLVLYGVDIEGIKTLEDLVRAGIQAAQQLPPQGRTLSRKVHVPPADAASVAQLTELRRDLGSELIKLRKARGLQQKRVLEDLGWERGKLIRIEQGKRLCARPTLEELLNHYQVKDADRQRLLGLYDRADKLKNSIRHPKPPAAKVIKTSDLDDESISRAVPARFRLARALRELRATHGETQENLAKDMDWSTSKVNRIERGEVDITQSDLTSLLNRYNVENREPFLLLYNDAKNLHRRQVSAKLVEAGLLQAADNVRLFGSPQLLLELFRDHHSILTQNNPASFNVVLPIKEIERLNENNELPRLREIAELPHVTIWMLPEPVNSDSVDPEYSHLRWGKSPYTLIELVDPPAAVVMDPSSPEKDSFWDKFNGEGGLAQDCRTHFNDIREICLSGGKTPANLRGRTSSRAPQAANSCGAGADWQGSSRRGTRGGSNTPPRH